MSLHTVYRDLEHATGAMLSTHPDWPCTRCPVAKTKDNCCHHGLFYVSKTEWEVLKRHPYLQAHKKSLRKHGRRILQQLRQDGYDTETWSDTIRASGDGHIVCTCPLLVEGKCQAYDARPSICRLFGVSGGKDGVYGCTIAQQQAAGKTVAIVDRDAFLQQIQQTVEGPALPLPAWLATDL